MGRGEGSHQPCLNSCPWGGNIPSLLLTLLSSVTTAPPLCQSSLPQTTRASVWGHFSIPNTVGRPVLNDDPTTEVTQYPYLQESVRLREAEQLAWSYMVSEGT